MKPQQLNLTLIILLLLVLPLTIAADPITITPTDTEPTTTTSTETDTESTTIDTDTAPDLPSLPIDDENKEFPTDPKEGGKVVLTAAKQAALDALKEPTSNKSEVEPLELADILQKPTMFIFAIKDQEEIGVRMFVVLISLFIGLFILLYELVDIFSDNWILRLSIGLVLTLMAAGLGTIARFATALTKLSPETILGQTTNLVFIIIGIIIVVIAAIFIKDIIKGLKHSTKLERAERGGTMLGSQMKVALWRAKRAKQAG